MKVESSYDFTNQQSNVNGLLEGEKCTNEVIQEVKTYENEEPFLLKRQKTEHQHPNEDAASNHSIKDATSDSGASSIKLIAPQEENSEFSFNGGAAPPSFGKLASN
jgi:hypothetical protein